MPMNFHTYYDFEQAVKGFKGLLGMVHVTCPQCGVRYLTEKDKSCYTQCMDCGCRYHQFAECSHMEPWIKKYFCNCKG